MKRSKHSISALILVSVLLVGGVNTMNALLAIEPQVEAPDWARIKKNAQAEAEAVAAQKQALQARQALEAAQDPASKELEDKLAAAKAAQAIAEAQKSAAEAQKAAAEAQATALKTRFGDIPTSPYTGDVTLKEKVGGAEAALLAARAANLAAQKIAAELPGEAAIPGQASTPAKTVFLYAGGELPTFQSLIAYRAQITILRRVLQEAQTASDTADSNAPETAQVRVFGPIPMAAGLSLDAVNKLLAFFRTDYTIGGVDLSVNDSLLVHAVAGAITNSGKYHDVRLTASYNPASLAAHGAGIITELMELSASKTSAQHNASRHEKLAAKFSEQTAKEPDPAKKAKLLAATKLHKAAADNSQTAVGLYDSVFSKLTTADDKGIALLTNVVREGVIADALSDGNLLLIIKMQNSGGSYYTKKNMWTLFGGMPLYHMGGIVASYALLEGKEGRVLKSGVVPVHGGFIKAGDLQKQLER